MDYLKGLEEKYSNIAYIYAMIGYTTQAMMQVIFKFVTLTVSPFQALFMRAFTLFCFNCFILRHANQTPYIKDPHIFRMVLKRLFFSTLYAVIVHYCVKYLPVSTVSTLSNTGPIFIFFIEAIYYGKALNRISLALTCISFTGVVLIMQPDFLFHNTAIAIPNYQMLSFMVIVGAICFSFTMIYIHDVGNRISSIVNLHYSYIGHMFLTSFIDNFDNPTVDFAEIDFTFILAFSGVVVLALCTQYMIFAATALKKPSKTMPFGYVAIVTTFTADVFMFDIKFNFLQILGIALTSVGLLSKYLIGDEGRAKSQHPLEIAYNSEDEENDRISREEQRQKL